MSQKTQLDRRAFLRHLLALLAAGIALMLAGCAQAPSTGSPAATTAPTLPSIQAPTATATLSPKAVPATITTAATAEATAAVEATSAPSTATATPAPTPSPAEPTALPRGGEMKIRLTIGNEVVTATLNDSAAAREFASLLPLTLTLEDYNGTEKVADLSKRLSTQGAPAGIDPEVGDITQYSPWSNLAIFYRDFGYSAGLVLLGKIDGGMELLSVPGAVSVTIERVE